MAKWASGNFSLRYGEIAPELEWRRDLGLYYAAARRMENAWPLMSGGVMARPGTRYLATLSGQNVVVPFVFDENERHLIELVDGGWNVLDYDGSLQSSGTGAPWVASDTFRWTILGDVIILCVRGKRTQILRRTAYATFSREDFAFSEVETANGKRRGSPHAFFESRDVDITPSGTTGSITLTASADLFDSTWVGERLRIKQREVEVTAVSSATSATATVQETLVDTAQTADWTREAIGVKAGWPETPLFFAGRLWFAGAPALPYRIFGSKVGDWYRFEPGAGNDDDAIAADIQGEDIQKAVHLAGRDDLFVLTSSRVFALRRNSDGAFSPKTATFTEASRTGTSDPSPVIYDDAVVFVGSNGRHVSEVAWDGNRETHTVSNLSLMARHLVVDPIDMGVIRVTDRPEAALGVVMQSGEMMFLFSLRQEKILFASRWTTDGSFKQILPLGNETLLVVERSGAWLLERLETASAFDASLHQTAAVNDISMPWAANRRVIARNGWAVVYDGTMPGGVLANSDFAWEEAGLPCKLLIETLPIDGVLADAPIPHRVKRIHTMNLRVIDATRITVAGVERNFVANLDVDASSENAYDGIVRYHLLGAGREMTVTITTESPSPLKVLGYMLEATI